jgi:hypothetical protein
MTLTLARRDALHLCRKVLGLVVDGVVGAELEAVIALGIAASRDNDRRAPGLGQLNRRHANAAAAALHQQGFAGLQSAPVKHIAPDREEGLGQAAACTSLKPRAPAGTGPRRSAETRHSRHRPPAHRRGRRAKPALRMAASSPATITPATSSPGRSEAPGGGA